MKSKKKMTMITCFTVAGVLLLALVIMINFDKFGPANEEPIKQLPGETTEAVGETEDNTQATGETEFLEIPVEDTTAPSDADATTQPTETEATTQPTTPGNDTPTNPTPTQPATPTNPGNTPAEEEEGDIQIEIGVVTEPTGGNDDNENDGDNDGDNDGEGGNAGNGGNDDAGVDDGSNKSEDGVIDFDDLIKATEGND